MHRTDLKGVKIGSSASKMCKLCVIGSPAAKLRKKKKKSVLDGETPVRDELQP